MSTLEIEETFSTPAPPPDVLAFLLDPLQLPGMLLVLVLAQPAFLFELVALQLQYPAFLFALRFPILAPQTVLGALFLLLLDELLDLPVEPLVLTRQEVEAHPLDLAADRLRIGTVRLAGVGPAVRKVMELCRVGSAG